MASAPRHGGAARSATLLRVFLPFWPDLAPFAAAAGCALVASALSPFLDTAAVWVFQRIVDDVLVPRHLAALRPLAGLLLAIAMADAAAGAADRLLSAWASEAFHVALRARVLRHLLGLPIATLERRPAGDVASRLEADTGAVTSFLVSGLAGASSHALRVLFFTCALVRLDAVLAATALCALPLFAVAVRRFSARIRAAARDERRHAGSAAAVAQEAITAAALVQAFGGEDAVCDRYVAEARSGMRAHLAGTRSRALLSPLLDLTDVAAGLAVVAIGTWALAHGRLSLGGLLAFITYLGKLYGPVRALGSFGAQAWSAAAAAERVGELLSEPRAVATPRRWRAPGRSRGVVTFDDVRFRHPGADEETLRGVSFELEPGKVVALVGPSGVGKSTVVRLLLRLYEPTGGRILLDGVDARELPVEVLRGAVGLVPQETVLFHASVRDNVRVGRPAASDREVRVAARRAGADAFVRALPAGYDTVLGERGMRLSGGQRQRIALARALVRDAPILILDEPTAGLDAGAARRVLAVCTLAAARRSTLVITHDLAAVRGASEILVLSGGRVAERGSHGDLSARDGLYAALGRGEPARAAGPGR
jgi:ABC-type multidrug transport system fused ATPase/permease subunit